ncbi:MAG: LysM peptidoglycan-binding domain-containing protein [Anaerocolumna sp.]
MIIHVVQPGDTIYTIAAEYNISVTRLVVENGLTQPEDLVIGQTIVITNPSQVYIAREGDTLESIAIAFDVSVLQLMRNNPNLYGREYIYQGELIIISYDTQGDISINGYAYPFINSDILRKTLPYLTYLTIYNYRFLRSGEVIGNDETEVIAAARAYGVAPLMSLSTLNYQGVGDYDTVNSILYDEEVLERNINNVLSILREKNYYGLNLSIVNINHQNLEAYENYIKILSERLRAEGYVLFITITPRVVLNASEITIERLGFEEAGRESDGIFILSYGWGSFAGPPSPITPVYIARQVIELSIDIISAEKVNIGISVIGYDWEEPYVIGITRANALTTESAINLALQTESVIYFDENAMAPYFEYTTEEGNRVIRHTVWFSDARTIDALIKLVPEYGVEGCGIWNIMNYFTQMWLVINTQYNINKIDLET